MALYGISYNHIYYYCMHIVRKQNGVNKCIMDDHGMLVQGQTQI